MTMSRVVLLAFGLATFSIILIAEETPNCERLSHYGGLQCCYRDVPRTPRLYEVKKCLDTSKKHPQSCQFEMCLANIRGLILEDGSLDRKKMAEDIKIVFENDVDLADTIIDNCINGNLSKYETTIGFCEVMKLRICIEVQVIMTCDEWDDEGDCSGIKETVTECVKKFL